MQDSFTNLEKFQKKLVKASQKFLESSKLKIWSFKADLIHLAQQKKKISETIQASEERFAAFEKHTLNYQYELDYQTESIFSSGNLQIFCCLKPWKIVQDICAGICSVLGFSTCSWEHFVTLTKTSRKLKCYLKSFDPTTINEETYEFISNIVKKHGINTKTKEPKVSEEFVSLFNWFQNAYFLVFSLKSSEATLAELESLNKKHIRVYLTHSDLQHKILETEEQVQETQEILKKCEKTQKMIKKRKSVELIVAELSWCDKRLSFLRGDEKTLAEDTPISHHIDSHASHCYSPDPRVLEYKHYYEESFHELLTQKGNTFENSLTEPNDSKRAQNSAKKRCCGLGL